MEEKFDFIVEGGCVYQVKYFDEEKTVYHKVSFDTEHRIVFEAATDHVFANDPLTIQLRKEKFDILRGSYILDTSFNGTEVLLIDPLDYPVVFKNGSAEVTVTINGAGEYDIRMPSQNCTIKVTVTESFS